MGNYKVLVTDDSAFTRRVTSSALDGTEFEVVATAANGKEAVDLFQEHSPDIVLIDVIMPEMNGQQALEKMMELNQKMMEDLPLQLKQSLKMMLITLVPIILLFSWLREVYETTTIASTWIWWYIGFSLVFSIILGKILKLD